MNAAKPRICLVGLETLPVLAAEYSEHGIGGEQVQHALLAKALHRRGFPVSIVTGDYGQPDGAVWSGVTVRKAFSPDEGIPVLRFIYPRWWKLASAMSRAHPDVVYISCAGAHVGQVAMWARRHGVRLVFRAAHDRDCVPDELIVPRRTYWRDKLLYRYGLRHADTILVQTEAQRKLMHANFGFKSSIAGMLVEDSSPALPDDRKDIEVLWVNNIRSFKRPELFIELARMLPQYRFHMIGGPQSTEPSLYDQVATLASKVPNLEFHGQVPYQEINHYYARARVFVNTSDTEGFPNSYLQAWIRGCPVVAFFDPDSTIERYQLGARAGSMLELSTSVAKLLSDKTFRAARSAACLAYMAECFAEDRIIQPYLEAFTAHLAGCAPRADQKPR